MTIRKVFGTLATELGPRRVRVQCSSNAIDRSGEIVEQPGIFHAALVPLLWTHDPAMPRSVPSRSRWTPSPVPPWQVRQALGRAGSVGSFGAFSTGRDCARVRP